MDQLRSYIVAIMNNPPCQAPCQGDKTTELIYQTALARFGGDLKHVTEFDPKRFDPKRFVRLDHTQPIRSARGEISKDHRYYLRCVRYNR